jgi:di/tricarboxylate transporter
MNSDQALSLLILLATLGMFVWGRYRYDVVAALALVAVTAFGLIQMDQALTGFGNPAVITVAAVLVISQALKNSGVVELIGRKLDPLTVSPFLHIASMSLVVAVASAFMNNVGAMAVMLPVALASCAKRERSPAIVLMPLAFGSILGGLMTMIGTPPNLLISQYRAQALGESFGMFDFSWVGVPVALAGVAFVAMLGWRLVPKERRGRLNSDQMFEIDDYFFEVSVAESSDLVGKRFHAAQNLLGEDVEIAGRMLESGNLGRLGNGSVIQADDVLLIKADAADLKSAMNEHDLQLAKETPSKLLELESDDIMVVEAVVSPDSRIVGRTTEVLQRWSGNHLYVLAIARQGKPIRRRLGQVRINAGDVLMMRGDKGEIGDGLAQLNLLPLPERGLQLTQPDRLITSLVIFAIAIGLGVSGVLPTAVAFVAAILAYVMSGVLTTRDLYSAIDWPIIVLLGAMIPVGLALEQTGTTQLIASQLVGMTGDLPPWTVLLIVMVVTMFLSDIINNAATVVVMAPIAIQISLATQTSPDPWLMAVAVAASCAFLTPIGHQSNTLVMGPGGYRFGDYWRMGLPLEVVIVAIGLPVILLFWPL